MNSREMVAYQCTTCSKRYFSRVLAEKCCAPKHCEVCGAEIPRYKIMCEPCRMKSIYEKAEKLVKWDGWVYCEGLGYDEGFFTSIDDLEEYCEDTKTDLPAWVLAVEEVHHAIDVDSVIETMLENAYEDAIDNLVDEQELRDFIDAWNAKQTVTTYYPDYKRVVLVKERKGDNHAL